MAGIALSSRLGGRLGKYSDLIMAVAVLGVVVMLIVPLPEWLLDTCLVVNLAGAALIFLTTLYVQEPLQFSVFPSLLLIATLFRLSLNIAATKLILGSGSAGRVIEAFGNFVVGGDYVVGVVAFLILVIVQFVVITNGAGRVAEVAARFTLDAMPGKQMAIDADLNAGLITEEQAKERRKAIEEEADFYGAMDGASKFVRGDAIAAVLIIIINIVGGFLIGLRNGQGDAMTVLRTYTLLTVGEGLVAQIPALFISTAAGILVTRTATQTHLGQDLFAQLFSRARPAWIVAGMLVTMALVPGFPIIQLLLLAAALGGIGYAVTRSEKARTRKVESAPKRQPAPEAPKGPEAVLPLLTVDTIELELGLGLLGLVDASAGGDLVERINLIRRQTALELGIVLPSVRIRDNLQLKNDQYTIKIKGETVATGEVHPQYLLAMGGDDPQQMESLGGIPTREPAFGLSAYWIPVSRRDAAEMLGCTVVEPSAVIATHLTEIIKQHAADILTRQDVQTLLDHTKQHNAAVVQELIPDLMTIGEVQKVLQHLLRERVPGGRIGAARCIGLGQLGAGGDGVHEAADGSLKALHFARPVDAVRIDDDRADVFLLDAPRLLAGGAAPRRHAARGRAPQAGLLRCGHGLVKVTFGEVGHAEHVQSPGNTGEVAGLAQKADSLLQRAIVRTDHAAASPCSKSARASAYRPWSWCTSPRPRKVSASSLGGRDARRADWRA